MTFKRINFEQERFTRVSNTARRDMRLSCQDLSLYSAISEFADNIGAECFPSRETLMKASRIGSPVTYSASLKNLVALGYIKVTGRAKDGKQLTNKYILLEPPETPQEHKRKASEVVEVDYIV